MRRRRLLCLLRALPLLVAAAAWAPELALAEDAVSKLSEALGSSRSFKVRVQAAALLGRLKDPRAGQALVRAAASDPHPTLRGLAIKLLLKSALDDRIAVPVARQAMSRALNDGESSVRRQAAASLVELERAASPRERPSSSRPQPRPGPITVAVGAIGDRSGQASRPLREHMRAEIRSLLSRQPRLQLTESSAADVAFLVDGTISKLSVIHAGGSVETTCAVELVVSRPPRGIVTVASGEATVQKPRAQYQAVLRDRMEAEAMEHAVRSAHETLAQFLLSQ